MRFLSIPALSMSKESTGPSSSSVMVGLLLDHCAHCTNSGSTEQLDLQAENAANYHRTAQHQGKRQRFVQRDVEAKILSVLAATRASPPKALKPACRLKEHFIFRSNRYRAAETGLAGEHLDAASVRDLPGRPLAASIIADQPGNRDMLDTSGITVTPWSTKLLSSILQDLDRQASRNDPALSSCHTTSSPFVNAISLVCALK